MNKNVNIDHIFNINDFFNHLCIDSIKEIKEPQDYMVGLSSSAISLPDNIILFKRSERFKGGDLGAAHSRFVLILSLVGEGTVILEDRAFRLHAREGILVHPFQYHRYANMSKGLRKWLFITFEHMAMDYLEVMKNLVINIDNFDLMCIQKIMKNHIEEKGRGVTLLTANLLNTLLEKVETLKPKRNNNSDPAYGLLNEVMGYVNKNIDCALQVQDIAGAIGLSESYLRAKFKLAAGLSIGNYVRNTRLHRAAVYLSVSNLSITKIAEKTGFDSLFSFSRAFRAKYKKSPSEFRSFEKKLI